MDGPSTLSVLFKTKHGGWVRDWDFGDFDIPERYRQIEIASLRLDPEDEKFKKLLGLLQQSQRGRWSVVHINSIGDRNCNESSPEFLYTLVAAFGKTDGLQIRGPVNDKALLYCLNTSLAMKNHGLKAISFDYFYGSPFSHWEMVILGQGLFCSEQLESLSFSNVRMDPNAPEILNWALKLNETLNCFALEFCDLHPNDILAILSTLQEKEELKGLKLGGEEILSIPVQNSIRRWLAQEDCKLDELELCYSDVPSWIRDRPELIFADLERPNKSLTSLKLSGMKLESSYLERIPTNFESLVSLDLSKNEISDLRPLDQLLLGDNCHLEGLVLDSNAITIVDGLSFAERLTQMKVLRRLQMDDVLFLKDEASADNFFRIAMRNTSIEVLKTDAKKSTALTDMLHEIHLNRAGQRYLGHNPSDLPLNLLPLVLERARRINYYDQRDLWGEEPSVELDGSDAAFWLLRQNSFLQSNIGCRPSPSKKRGSRKRKRKAVRRRK
mmetsp:Transcript_11939/g.28589  ORF Transcript_11939/g.28589 Transcript_11939/m.28589 type:complete len:498 (+) Transcript_11939:111-1604(+)